MRPAPFVPLLAALALAGCWQSPTEFMGEPAFSPVGAGFVSDETAAIQNAHALVPPNQTFGPPTSLYTAPRISKVGDIVTVIIMMNDKATLGNESDRSQTTKDGLTIDYGFNNGSSASSSNQPAKILGDLTSTSSTQGQGDIGRSEQIQVSVAAVVTRRIAERQPCPLGLAGSAGQLRAATADGRGHRQSERHFAQEHDRLRANRRGAHFLWRARAAERLPAAVMGAANL